MPSSHLILCGPLLLLPPIPPSIKGFSNESTVHIRWPKYWSFSFSISPSNEYSGLISFRMDWLDLLAVQGTVKSLLQHHSSKASIILRSAFFIVQLSRWLLPNGKSLRFSVYLWMPHFSLKALPWDFLAFFIPCWPHWKIWFSVEVFLVAMICLSGPSTS